jgi:hypothetical protein
MGYAILGYWPMGTVVLAAACLIVIGWSLAVIAGIHGAPTDQIALGALSASAAILFYIVRRRNP